MKSNETDKAPYSAEPSYDTGLLTSTAVEMVTPIPSDRLYKFAAMTAGIFLLATLL